MPELDSVRGIAVLLVLFFHSFGFMYGTAGLSGFAKAFVAATLPGWSGVNLFFVLSGFLITGILIDGKERPRYYRRFYIRRALRILPAYYALLLVLLLLPRIGLVNRHVSWSFIGLSFIYLSNVANLFGVPVQYATLWSLSVEEHFYLLWPTVVRTLSRRNTGICAVAIFLICPMLRAFEFKMGYELGPYTWLCADGLALGAILAVLLRTPGFTRSRARQFSMLCAITGIVFFSIGYRFGIFYSSTLPGFSLRDTALNLVFTGILGAVLLLGTGPLKWAVCRPSLQFFGEISYGLYLYQRLIFDVFDHFALRYFPHFALAIKGHFDLMLLRFLIGGGMAVAIAFFSKRYYENAFMRFKDRWTIPRPVSVADQKTPEPDLLSA